MRRSYRCGGTDPVLAAHKGACPRADVNADQLEAAVWTHVRALLAAPEQLLAQFERFASGAAEGARQTQAAAQTQTRLDRLA